MGVQVRHTPNSRKVMMAATKGVSHWNRLYSANGRKLVHVSRNLDTTRQSCGANRRDRRPCISATAAQCQGTSQTMSPTEINKVLNRCSQTYTARARVRACCMP